MASHPVRTHLNPPFVIVNDTLDTIDAPVNDNSSDVNSASSDGTIESSRKHGRGSNTTQAGYRDEADLSSFLNQELQSEALAAFGIIAEHNKATPTEERNVNNHESLSGPALAACGIQPDDGYLVSSLEGNGSGEVELSEGLTSMEKKRCHALQDVNIQRPLGLIRRKEKIDFFGHFATYPELFMEFAKHMDINSLVSLYAISKDFHETLNGHMSHVMKACAAYQFPESSRIYGFGLYESLCIPDPVGRPHPIKLGLVRQVPSLRWLTMLSHRENVVRDILACMARESHRMPKTMSFSLKKMWLTMDISTSARRVQLMHNEKYWTDNDLYNIQLFLMKLDMRFNDPIDGPGDDGLKKLFLGQRGLTPLRDLLKRTRFTSILEIIQLAVRYGGFEGLGPNSHREMTLFGVPPEEVGIGHLEGWGRGRIHLYRIDELVMREAVRRNLELDKHLMDMMFWGYVNPVTKGNIEPSLEEMYMLDGDTDVSKHDIKGKGKHKMEDGGNDEDTEMELAGEE